MSAHGFRRWAGEALLALILALGGTAGLLLLTGYDPVRAYSALLQGAFGSVNAWAEMLLRATPLILIGSGLAAAFRAGLWNVGAEGQFYAGAVTATAVALQLAAAPGWTIVPLAMLGGAVGGAAWGGLAGWLKVRFQANEVVTTIMLNYIALLGVNYLVTGPLMEASHEFPQTEALAPAARLWRWLPPTRLHAGVFLALGMAVLIYLLLFKTSFGYGLRAVGVNPTAAHYAGIPVSAYQVGALALSGSLAGLAGAVEVTGLTYRLFSAISPGYGFTGVAVALLANNHPLAVLASGIFFGALRSGSEVMQITARVPAVLVSVLQGLVLMVVAGLGAWRWWRRPGGRP